MKDPLITGASVIVGYVLKQLAAKSWQRILKENSPSRNPSEAINWNKAIIWIVLTGTAISSAELATKRYLTLVLKEYMT